MARTRKQKQKQKQEQDGRQARREAAAARAARPRWSRPELLRLLSAWCHVLRNPKARLESSDEIELRLYNRFHALAPEVDDNGNGASASSGSNAKARPLQDGATISQAMQLLKRTFRFISEYNQQHCGPGTNGININNDVDNGQDNSSRTNPANEGIVHQGERENGSLYSRPWFQLTAEERQEKFMQGQRNRRPNSFMDIDEEMFENMTVIMTQTMRQIKKIRASSSKKKKSRDDSSSSASSLSEQPWSSAEIWQLLHAWRETLEEPHKPRVHSPEFLARIFQRFEDICEGNAQRTVASVRHRKTSLVSLFTLIKQINNRYEADRDWFALTSAERMQIYEQLNQKPENYSELDRGMFSMLTFVLKLEDDSYLANDHHHLQPRQLQQQQDEGEQGENEDRTDQDQHDGSSYSADGLVDLVSDYEYPSEDEAEAEEDGQDSHSSERKEETASYFADHGVEEQSSGAPLSESEDNNCDTSRDARSDSNDDVEVLEHLPVSRKRQRLDLELLSVVSILEKEAKHLRAMLEEAKDERELDREERRRLRKQMKQDQEDRRREQAQWRRENEQLLHELVRLRNQYR